VSSFERASEAAEWLRGHGCGGADVAVVLGSGLGDFADHLGEAFTIPYAEIPHWPASGVIGHAGKLVGGTLRGKHVLALSGRVHAYEGHDLETVTFAMRAMGRLGVPRVIWRIERYVPLPDLGAKFDVVTAHMICFNDHKTEQLWGPAEWKFFLEDMLRHLRPGARIHLEFNREFDGTWYTPELREYFASRGAEIDRHRVTLSAACLRP